MKLDDLKKDWQQAIQPESKSENIDEVVTMLADKTKKIDKEIKRRDALEISIAVLLIPAWIYGLVISVSTMQTLGCILALVSCCYIPYRLISARRVASKKSDNTKAFLLQERQKLVQQKKMLESILWWYIGPIALSIVLITLGGTVTESGWPQVPANLYWYYASLVVLMVGVFALNKRAAKKKFGPLIDNIDQRLSEID